MDKLDKLIVISVDSHAQVPAVEPALIAHFDLTGGYLKPPEGRAKLQLVEEVLSDDVARVVAGGKRVKEGGHD